MQIIFGHDYFDAKNGRKTPIKLDTKRLINPHIFIVGASGVGKSITIRDMVEQGHASSPKTRFHIFDVHGDLRIPDASEVRFSELAPYGLNPLRVNPDPEFGGVRKCINNFIRIINQASTTPLGVKQQAVVRDLLLDVYADFGFDPLDASTWAVNAYDVRMVSGARDNRIFLDVPYAEKDAASAFGARWDPSQKLWWVSSDKYAGGITKWKPAYKSRTYPTVDDVLQYARNVYDTKFLGTDSRGVKAFEYLNKKVRSWQKKLLDALKLNRLELARAEMQEDLEEAKEDAKEAAVAAIEAITTGYEYENLKKYRGTDILESVIDRLNILKATGLFKNEAPPFDHSKMIWRYNLRALEQEEKKMMVYFLLNELMSNAMQRGEQDDVMDIAVLDELGVYTSSADKDGGDGIIGIICREARKFGLGLWAANQSPEGVPSSLITSVGTKIILGMDGKYFPAAVREMQIELNLLKWITPWHSMAVQMKEAGNLKLRWWWTEMISKQHVVNNKEGRQEKDAA